MIKHAHVNKLFSAILAIILLLNLFGPIIAEASGTSTYEQLKDNEFVQRLKNSGATDAQIKTFLDQIDAEILLKGEITEDNFDRAMYETLKDVIVRPKNATVYRAMLIGFSEEIDYTLLNKELHPNMLPLRNAVKNIILGDNGGTIPEEPVISKDNLAAFIEKAQKAYDSATVGTNPGQYPLASKTALYSAISVAKAAIDKQDATQSEIDGTILLLQDALTVFENSKIKDTPGTPTNPGTPNTDETGSTTQPPAKEDQNLNTQPKLKDIAGHWAESKIVYLVGKGAVTGYPDGTFKPNNNITRSEFITILVKALNLEIKTGKLFKDTEKNWAKDYISTAYAYGITNGYNEDFFGPNDFITREQIVAMVVKAANLKSDKEAKAFDDGAEASSWAKDAINTASGLGIVSGRQNNRFEPKSNANRAEAVTVIVNMLKALNK